MINIIREPIRRERAGYVNYILHNKKFIWNGHLLAKIKCPQLPLISTKVTENKLASSKMRKLSQLSWKADKLTSWEAHKQKMTVRVTMVRSRLRRWSFFHNDGMVMFFFQGTIAINGFSMVLPSLDHHHWMFFCSSTIEIDGFSMVFPNSGVMVSDGFDFEKDLKMRIIVTYPFFARTVHIIKDPDHTATCKF